MSIRKTLKGIGRFLLVTVASGLVMYLILLITAKPAPAAPWFAPRPGDHTPLVLAHQGGEGQWPSNTLLAFRNAAQAGADVLDTDMHLTQDGVLILMHDQTVDRTTDGSGAIRDLTLAEIKQFDAAYDFSPDGGKSFPYRGQGVRVPTLEELFQTFPDKRFGIEIKQTEPIETAQRFCAAIRQYQVQDQVLVSSFRQENMDAFRQACPEAATSATEDEVKVFYLLNQLGLTRALTPHYSSFQVPEKSGGIQVLTPQFINAARERNLPIMPWTINEAADLQRLIALGVKGINTDYPDRLLELLR
ncbi:glycerophosphoryl diester phosphodiesterase [Thermoflexales bacterium]|nr:glycerophosphoryl diester phosphodiesterase [Thermoflexales bacterium]